MAQDSDVEQDLSHIHWSWPEAIAANPVRSLATADLAMDYFAYSPFFDTKSNNSVLRTQRRVENPAYGHAEEKIELNAFRSGFEYIVAHAQPPELFVIHRRDVLPDGERSSISAAYFILQDKVYPTPTLYGVMSARMRNAAHLISKAFSTLSSAHPPANPRATSQWRALPPSNAPPIPVTSANRHHAETEDVEMVDSATPAGIDNPKVEQATGTASAHKSSASTSAIRQPDYHLFNALQATRAAMGDIDRLAAQPPAGRDPRDDLKAVEAQIMGIQGKAKRGSARVGDSAINALPARSVRIGGTSVGTPAATSSGGQAQVQVRVGRASSIATTSGAVQSPLAQINTIAT